ncbi:hypothetical protein BVRB_5g115210 [Beta vulgaris subsp. vulgaris]|nr:hypothetical protein BVRB_5g115210 [Beta vulgaris subsp. vulgaris]
MTEKSKTLKTPQKSRLDVTVNKPKGPVSDSQAKKTKSIDTILGIPAMKVDSGEESMDRRKKENFLS